MRRVSAMGRGEVREIEPAVVDVVAERRRGTLEKNDSEARESNEDGENSDEHAHHCERRTTTRTRNVSLLRAFAQCSRVVAWMTPSES